MIYFICGFAFLFALDLFLDIFFQIKDFSLQKQVTHLGLIPLAAGFFLSILYLRFPDSIHIISFLTATSISCEIALVFHEQYKKNIKAEILLSLTRFFSLLTILLWVRLNYSSLHLVRTPSWFYWLFLIAFSLFFIVFAFLQHGERPRFYLYFALVFFSAGFLIFTSLAEIGYSIRLHSVIGFAGGLMFLSSVILLLSKKRQFTKKHTQFIFELLFVFSQIVISTAVTVMIAA